MGERIESVEGRMNDGRTNGKKGHIRVEEPLVLATGEATEIVANSIVLIAWTRKLLGSHVSITVLPGVEPRSTQWNTNLRSC
jgi:hypothetical protein